MEESPKLNVWSYKPWWCQPWSILLTGITLIGGSWVLVRSLWVTGLVSLPVLAWMGYFLIVWPRLMAQYYAQAMPETAFVPPSEE